MQKLRMLLACVVMALALVALGVVADASATTTTKNCTQYAAAATIGIDAVAVDNSLIARFDPGGFAIDERILSMMNPSANTNFGEHILPSAGVGPEPSRTSALIVADAYTTGRAPLDFVQYGALEVHQLDFPSPSPASTTHRAQIRAFPLLI